MGNDFSLSNRNAIITGATRGIGLAIAEHFLVAGARVTLCGRKQEGVDAALDQLSAHGENVHGVTAHVGERESLEALVDAATSRFGPVNVVVNNAGTNPYFGPILDAEDAAWDKTMDVNLKGPYMLSNLVARQVDSDAGASIINVASIAGLTAMANQGIYSVSKAALIMLTKVMAREFGGKNIRVNAICPGLIKTRLSEAMWSNPAAEKQIKSMKALGRIGAPNEIAGAAVYFASDASSFTTGAILLVDGGMVI